ncbi:MAG: trigger factor [Candidatus Omnitrophica bacterium]|nr:trigger factor [Candidatus Omnitrophota bacterium]
MKYQVKALEGCARLLEIKAEPKEVQEALEGVFGDIQRVAHVPGFRIGKAPRDLVEKHYSESVRKELLRRFIPDLYEKVLQESRLEVLGLPEITDVLFEKSQFSFKAKIETKPSVPLRKYKGLKASRKRATVTPEEIQESLQRLREEWAELAPKEGVVEEDDFAVCDFEGAMDGKPTESRKNVLLSASLKAQRHPEVAKALWGAKIGEVREVEVTLESPGGVMQKARYRITINEVKQKTLPELNDDFAKMVGRFGTLKELEETLSKDIQREKEQKARKQLERELLTQLQKECSFELPRLLVEEEARRLSDEERFHFKLLGLKDREIETKIAQDKGRLLEEAKAHVKNSLILEKIAELEKIEVHAEEIDEGIKTLGTQLQKNDEAKAKDLSNESLRRRMAGDLLLEKALSRVVEFAHIQEVA